MTEQRRRWTHVASEGTYPDHISHLADSIADGIDGDYWRTACGKRFGGHSSTGPGWENWGVGGPFPDHEMPPITCPTCRNHIPMPPPFTGPDGSRWEFYRHDSDGIQVRRLPEPVIDTWVLDRLPDGAFSRDRVGFGADPNEPVLIVARHVWARLLGSADSVQIHLAPAGDGTFRLDVVGRP